jgi:Ser/Thr protein kinase RdoA (MazF antagonist)
VTTPCYRDHVLMGEGAESPVRGSGLQDRKLVRVGDAVRRPSGPFTASVHHLLRHLRDHGFDLAPEPRGVDEAGREILSFIEGRDSGWPMLPEILRLEGSARFGELASRLRSALVSYECPPTARWQFATGAPGPGEAMQHGDLGPWNLLWGEDGQVVGILDWDFAQPGAPMYDTGHLAWFTVPLLDDDRANARGFPVPPDRLARLEAFAAGAGLTRAQVLKAALAAQAEYEHRVISRRRAGGSWALFYQRGFHNNAARDRRWTVTQYGHILR